MNNKYNFEDNTWTFTDALGKKYNFSYSKFLDNSSFVKKYIDILLKKKELKYSSIYKRFSTIAKFFKYIGFETSIIEIHTFHIEEFLEELTEQEHYNTVFYLYEFFKLYSSVVSKYVLDLLSEQKDTFKLKKSGHFKMLPRSFVNDFIHLCFKEIKNENNPNDVKLMFSLLLLQTQIGLRVSELTNLESDDLIGKLNPNVGNILRYKIYKGISEEKKYKTADTFMNPIALKAFCKCLQLSKNNAQTLNIQSNKIFVPENNMCYDLNSFLQFICINYHKELSTRNNLCYNKFMNILTHDGDTYCYPTTHQFRVFRINWLLQNNVPLEKIQTTIGHNDEYTTMSYARTNDVEQEKVKRLIYGFYSKESIENLIYLAQKQYDEEQTGEEKNISNGFCLKKDCFLRTKFMEV